MCVYHKLIPETFANLIVLVPEKVTMRMKTQKPACPPKPTDLAQRVRSLMAQKDDAEREFAPRRKTDVTQSMYVLPSRGDAKSQITNEASSRSYEDLDIPFIDDDED